MARKFELIPTETVDRLVLNAGVILSSFTPSSNPTISSNSVLFATDGGTTVTIVPEYIDMADGLDNCPSNTKDLKRLKKYTVTMSGTAKTIDDNSIGKFAPLSKTSGSGETAGVDVYKPKKELADGDFATLWFVCDYGSVDGSYIAIKIVNALNTGGFSLQSADGDKASFAFSFVGHYSASDTATAPVEIYIYEKKATV